MKDVRRSLLGGTGELTPNIPSTAGSPVLCRDSVGAITRWQELHNQSDLSTMRRAFGEPNKTIID